MKLKTCKNIEILLQIIVRVIMIPLLPIGAIGYFFLKIYTYVDDFIEEKIFTLSNKMLCNSDEVRNGMIKNKEAINQISSLTAWERLKSELKKKE